MYKFIAALSVIIRTFYLPNPFDSLGTTFPVTIGENTLTMTPIVMNYLAETVLHALTFALVGLYYSRSEHNPSKGSFLYLMFYCVHVGLLYLMGLFGFATWAVALILIVYAMAHIGFNALKNRVRYGV